VYTRRTINMPSSSCVPCALAAAGVVSIQAAAQGEVECGEREENTLANEIFLSLSRSMPRGAENKFVFSLLNRITYSAISI
jgi:hypothetical protein